MSASWAIAGFQKAQDERARKPIIRHRLKILPSSTSFYMTEMTKLARSEVDTNIVKFTKAMIVPSMVSS